MILSPDLHDIERIAQSNAERRLARLLHSIPDVEAVAFYSVKLRSHEYKQVAEADFVVLWKGVAITIEVKGGGIKKFEGVWYTTDRNGDSHKLGSSPMEQARSAMFALRDIMREDGLGWFAKDAIVVTPDIDAPPNSTEWKASHWLAKDSMNSSSLAAALSEVARNAPTAPHRERVARIDDLRSRLFGEFARVPVIDAQRGAVIDAQNTATEGQARVLAGLARNPRIMVLGGAGTGKSILMAEAAKQEADVGRSVLITFRSPGLKKFFEDRVSGRSITVTPFQDLLATDQYDVVLVDEAQDLMFADAMDLVDAVLVGGRASGRWRMFLDPNNQAQVDGQFDSEVYELVGTDSVGYDLGMNVRNTKAIVHMVQEYLGADVGDPGIVHGESIQWRWFEIGLGVEEALKVAEAMRVQGVPASGIWVVPVDGDPTTDEMHGGIRVLSPRVAKGLEADHVIVCNLPSRLEDASLANLYVAVTRPRVTLHIVAQNADKKRLQVLAGLQRGRL